MLRAFEEQFQFSYSPAGSVVLWRMPSARFLEWTGGWLNGFNCAGSPVHLTSVHAFKDFSLCALLTLLPLLAQGPLHQFALHSASAPPTFSSSFQKQKQSQSMDLWQGRILVFVQPSCLPSLKTLCLCDGFLCISVLQWICCMDSAC